MAFGLWGWVPENFHDNIMILIQNVTHVLTSIPCARMVVGCFISVLRDGQKRLKKNQDKIARTETQRNEALMYQQKYQLTRHHPIVTIVGE